MFTPICGDHSSERVLAHLQRRRGDWVIPECPQARRIKNVDSALFDEGYDADEKNGPFYDAVKKLGSKLGMVLRRIFNANKGGVGFA